MSEPIPESIPTSADPRSQRPLKRIRGNNTSNPSHRAAHEQANAIEFLMLEPERPLNIPAGSKALSTSTTLAPPPEFVANVQGSSAGAGSGEFHVYKASRRREYERLRAMDEESKREEDEAQWERKERERKEKDDEKTRKNREKRNRRKGKKGAGGSAKSNGVDEEDDEDRQHDHADGGLKNGQIKKPLNIPRRGDEIRGGGNKDNEGASDMGVAQVVKENGIVIHDDD